MNPRQSSLSPSMSSSGVSDRDAPPTTTGAVTHSPYYTKSYDNFRLPPLVSTTTKTQSSTKLNESQTVYHHEATNRWITKNYFSLDSYSLLNWNTFMNKADKLRLYDYRKSLKERNERMLEDLSWEHDIRNVDDVDELTSYDDDEYEHERTNVHEHLYSLASKDTQSGYLDNYINLQRKKPMLINYNIIKYKYFKENGGFGVDFTNNDRIREDNEQKSEKQKKRIEYGAYVKERNAKNRTSQHQHHPHHPHQHHIDHFGDGKNLKKLKNHLPPSNNYHL